MLEWLTNIDRAILFAINGTHNGFFDGIMWELSGKYIWLMVFITMIYLYIKVYKRWAILLMAVAGLLFAVTDQSSTLTKNHLKRHRPTHNPEILQKVRFLSDYDGGDYGFFSGHASNSFALCAFFYFVMRRRLKGAIWVFAFAFLTSYSRIYLGVHYPSDVFVGALFGTAMGWVAYYGVCQIKGAGVAKSGT